jgi:hypothetical protein
MRIKANRQSHQQARLLAFRQISHVAPAMFAFRPLDRHLPTMCGRVIQSSGPIRYGIVEGLDAHDSRVHNYPPRWNAAPSQELLVIRRNHQTGGGLAQPAALGSHSLLVPGSERRAQADQRQMRDGGPAADVSGGVSPAPLHFCRWTASTNGRRSRARRRSSPMGSRWKMANRSGLAGSGKTGRTRPQANGFALSR